MTKKIKNQIAQNFKTNVKSIQILFSLRMSDSMNVNFMFKFRNIYNLNAELRREIFESLILMQALLQKLNLNKWTYAVQKNVNNQIIYLFFIRNISQQLWLWNHEVFIMNSTYKTNKYKMPLLIIESQTALNINFYVTFCFITQKKIYDYQWILNQLFFLYQFHKLSDSTMIVIDMKFDKWTSFNFLIY